MPRTRADMRARIMDELLRPDLATQVDLAISSAIAQYQHERWHWARTNNYTLAITAGQAGYLYEPEIVSLIDLRWVNGTDRRRLVRLEWDDYQDLALFSAASGTPDRYATSANNLYLYPTPDATGSFLQFDFWRAWPEPADDTDADSEWMNEGEALIRWTAKAMLCQDVIGDAVNAPVFDGMAWRERLRLRRKHARRTGADTMPVQAYDYCGADSTRDAYR